MSLFRGFIAVDIPVSSKIQELLQALDQTGADLKLVSPENIHITLKFLGDTKQTDVDAVEKVIQTAASKVQPFTIQLQGTGVFPNTNYIKVIWVGVDNFEPLVPVVKEINTLLKPLGFKSDSRVFSPHITVGRMRNARNKDDVLRVINTYKSQNFQSVLVSSVKLIKSTLTPKGPVYETVRECMLADAASG